MAEGVVYEVPNLDTKYFCHSCSRVVSPNRLSELICPHCSNGFLEEMSQALFESGSPNNSIRFDDFIDEDLLTLTPSEGIFENEEARILSRLHHEIFLPSDSGSDTQEDQEADSSLDSFVEFMRNAPPPFHPFEGDADDGFVRMRYFEDFNVDADVDAIASQLLDEVEISGPPPLSKDQIKALPLKVFSSIQEVGDTQCTICMNDFKVGDKAKQLLACEHFFHEKCITPWLEKQASCPNCRCTVKVESKTKRSHSCPRTVTNIRSRPANTAARRFSEATSLGDFFTTSMNMNPFRFL